MTIKAIRGFKDILPPETRNWQELEELARACFETFGFSEIRTPILEKTEVFNRGIGEHTDIVEKEMYSFLDRNGESLTLRPEATAGIIRAYIENKLYNRSTVQKLYTIGPMFRHERPQKGRLRQFHQINAELLGSDDPLSDAEVIGVAWEILQNCGLKGELRLEVNSLGCPKCRPGHRKDLLIFLENNAQDLCEDCKRRMKTNPLRVFDCKKDECKRALLLAPVIKHYWCPDCSEHLGRVLDYLEFMEIPFVINPYLVRGLDYYQRTTFEIKGTGLGAQDTVAAGGRYDGLVKLLGGPEIPGVGMAIGIERALLLMEEEPEEEGRDCYFVVLDNDAMEYVIRWMKELRQNGLICETSYGKKSLKAQLRAADRAKARFSVIVGESELDEEEAILRDMKTHEQWQIPFDQVVREIVKRTMEHIDEEAKKAVWEEDEESDG